MLHAEDDTKLLVHAYYLNNSSQNYQKILIFFGDQTRLREAKWSAQGHKAIRVKPWSGNDKSYALKPLRCI